MRRQKIIWVHSSKKTLELTLRDEIRRITQVSHIPGMSDESHNSNRQVGYSTKHRPNLPLTLFSHFSSPSYIKCNRQI